MSVDILMATYNGERYLSNQLLSLQQQTYKDWTLWIRDDGSTDDTTFMLRKFAKSDRRIKIIEESCGQHLGPGRNFLSLTKCSTADYVIFCDQDDIWFEKKLEILADFAEKNFDADIPCLVYCDAYGYSDTEGIITADGIYRYHAKTLREFLFFNGGYPGCSILFNRRLCIIAAEYRANYYYLHDDVVSLLAHSFGRVYFLPKRLMLWRQHASNVTGLDLRSCIRRVIKKNAYVLGANHYKEKESFYNAYKDDLDEDARQLFAAYIAFPKETLLKRIVSITRHGFSIGGSKLTLIFKTIIWRPIE
jgi:rhamnosyltransferase